MSDKIYLSKVYRYRRGPILFAGFLLILFGCFVFFSFSSPIVEKDPRGLVFVLYILIILIFKFGVPVCLIGVGGFLLYAWMTDKVLKLEVTDMGIRYGSRQYPWAQINWFSLHKDEGNDSTLFLELKGCSSKIDLLITEPLTELEVERLYSRLNAEIRPQHLELQIGGTEFSISAAAMKCQKMGLLWPLKVNPGLFLSVYLIPISCILISIWISPTLGVGAWSFIMGHLLLSFLVLCPIMTHVIEGYVMVNMKRIERATQPGRFWVHLTPRIIVWLLICAIPIGFALLGTNRT